VTAFYQRVLSDSLLSPFFQNVEIGKLQRMQIAFFTVALGGAESDKMPSIADAHRGRGIEVKHLTRFTDLLVETLNEVGISDEDAKRVYERVATYAGDVLGESSVDG
jgi:hemoglobin